MDPTRATSPAGSQRGENTPQPDLPHSMLFVPKFTKAREPRPLNRDGTPLSRRFSPPIPAPAPADTNMGLPPAQIPSSAEVTPNVAYRGLGDD